MRATFLAARQPKGNPSHKQTKATIHQYDQKKKKAKAKANQTKPNRPINAATPAKNPTNANYATSASPNAATSAPTKQHTSKQSPSPASSTTAGRTLRN
jgi:hypothetical protein